MLKKSCVKVCDKAAVFSHYFLSALLQKELRPFQIATLDLAFFSHEKELSLWGSTKCFRQFQECEKGCLLSSHWLEEILQPLKWFHIQVLDLNMDIKLQLYKATLNLWLFYLWACSGIEWRSADHSQQRLLPMHPGHFACQILSLKKRAFSCGIHVSYFCQAAPAYHDGGNTTVLFKVLGCCPLLSM